MGPIEKKIIELSKTDGLSEETLMTLTILKNQVKEEEKKIVNDAYQQGFYDKEMSRRPNWNYFDTRYDTYLSKFKFGQLQ